MMLLLYLFLIISVSFYHGCNAEVTVMINDKNVTNGEAVSVSADSDLMVTCSSDNENDTVSLDSPDDGVNITKAYDETMLYSVVYTLHRVMKSSFNSTVTCEDGRNNTLSFVLNVTYAPEITLSEDSYLEMEGNNFSIPISISANPPVESVHWYMDGTVINDTNVMTSNDDIMFRNLDRMHGGPYSVQGVNSKGTGDNTTFLLTVYFDMEFAASVNDSNMTMVTLNEGDMYEIDCSLSSVGSHPPSTTIHIQRSNQSSIYNKSEMNITASRDTYYLCVAYNGMDTVQFNYSITVIPATNPSPSPTSSPTPSTTPPPGAGYTVTVSFGLVVIAIVLSFFIN